MKKSILSSLLILSCIFAAFAQTNTDAQKAPQGQTIQTNDKSVLNKKTIIALPPKTTNWSRIKDMFR